MSTPQTVWVGVVDHKHGTNIYAATTDDGVYGQVADYCREWWSREMPEGSPAPTGLADYEVVRAYFDAQSEHGDEWHLIEPVPLATED